MQTQMNTFVKPFSYRWNGYRSLEKTGRRLPGKESTSLISRYGFEERLHKLKRESTSFPKMELASKGVRDPC